MKFYQVTVGSWDELLLVQRKIGLAIFRGQSNSSWTLSSSLERALRGASEMDGFAEEREEMLVEQFIRRASHYLPESLKTASKFEILATMQHYGAPTRLLDFSKSFFVAMHFLQSSAETEGALWAVNLDFLQKRVVGSLSNIREENISIKFLYKFNLETCEKILAQEGKKSSLVVPAESYFQHEREVSQQAIYLFPSKLETPFYSLLIESLEVSNPEPTILSVEEIMTIEDWRENFGLVKIVVPYDLIFNTRGNLLEMNINEATLFPGLEGFSRSLRHYTSIGYLFKKRRDK